MVNFTGFNTFQVDDHIVEQLHTENAIPVWDKRYAFYPNLYVELRSIQKEKHTCLGRVNSLGTHIFKIEERRVSGISPRNREQVFALDALMDVDIPAVVLTGRAGTGKTLLALAAAFHFLENKTYSKCIITKPMSEIGRYKLGSLPGDVYQKFSPYLTNYMTNLEHFVSNPRAIQDLLEQQKFEIIPIQLFRGASFTKSLVIADELQVLNHSEMLALGTRIGQDSKFIAMGDLNQRDEKIAKEKTGLYKLMNSPLVKSSHLISTIELQRCERSSIAKLFADIFE